MLNQLIATRPIQLPARSGTDEEMNGGLFTPIDGRIAALIHTTPTSNFFVPWATSVSPCVMM